jgi:hypothetical protein
MRNHVITLLSMDETLVFNVRNEKGRAREGYDG